MFKSIHKKRYILKDITNKFQMPVFFLTTTSLITNDTFEKKKPPNRQKEQFLLNQNNTHLQS